MDKSLFYVGLAISGTDQETRTKINIVLISEYLERFAKKVAKEGWIEWLEDVGLGKYSEIKTAIFNYQKTYRKKVS